MIKSPPHILVVDNDIVILKFIEFILKSLNYQVTLSQDGKDAFAKANEQLFDLIISDLNVPLLDGRQLVRQIRKNPKYNYTPFVFLSESTEEDTLIKSLNEDVDDFITKPIKQKIFVSKIKFLLKKYYLRRDVLDSAHRKDISFEQGILVYCANRAKPYHLSHKQIKAKIKTIYTQNDFFMSLQELNVWGVIIDENADWSISILKKISEIVSKHIPISILISNYNNQEKMEEYMNCKITGFIHKNNNPKILTYQINSKIEREINLKNKYLIALNKAAKRSPISFENEFSDNLKDYLIQILHKPYDELPGGDYYEVFNVTENNKIIILGDVMGKKWDAWFFVAAYIAYIRSTINFFVNRGEIDFIKSPDKFLEIINRYVYKDIQLSEVFTTLSVITLCSATMHVNIASAGALRPFYYDSKENKISQLNVTGTLMGVMEDTSYKSITQKFNTNDKLLFFTDGYIEANNDHTGKMIGDNALLQILQQSKDDAELSPKVIEEKLIKTYNVSKFDDDRTLVLINR